MTLISGEIPETASNGMKFSYLEGKLKICTQMQLQAICSRLHGDLPQMVLRMRNMIRKVK